MRERDAFDLGGFYPKFKVVQKNKPGDNWRYSGVCCETEEAARKQIDILKKEYPGVCAWTVKPIEVSSQF